MAVSSINSNNMLICANNENSFVAKPDFDAKKPGLSANEPIPIVGKASLDRKPNPFEDKPIKVAGKEYKSIDDFLRHICYHKKVHVEDLTPEMKREVVKFYELACKKGIRFQLMCGYRTEEENQKRKDAAIAAGHPEAVGDDSPHKYGRAIDVYTKTLTDKQKWALVHIWRDEMKHRAGIDFPYPEIYHFDLGPDPELKLLSKESKNKKNINTKA